MTLERSCSLHVRLLSDSKFLQQLTGDNIDVNLLKKELYPEKSELGQNSAKHFILNILQCYPVQIIIALLVLIDAGVVIAEIVLEIHSMKNKIEAYSEQMRGTIHFLNQSYTGPPLLDSADQYSLEDMGSSHNELDILGRIIQILPSSRGLFALATRVNCSVDTFNQSSMDPSYQETRISDHSHQQTTITKSYRSTYLHRASETLHYASIVILGLFVLEVFLKILCIGPKFFKARFELIDAIVIVTSFVADIVIVVIRSQEISVMIIFLLWRIVRVINGLVMHEKQRDEFRIFLLKKARRISEMRLDELIIEKEMQEKHCNTLEELCLGAGISSDAIEKCRPKFTPVHKCHSTNPLKSIAAITTGFMGNLVGVHNTNRFIHRFVSHSTSSSPVFYPQGHLSPISAWSRHKESLAFAASLNHKSFNNNQRTLAISNDNIDKRLSNVSNQLVGPKMRRYRKKDSCRTLGYFNSVTDDDLDTPIPDNIDTCISSPTISVDWD